MESDIDAMVSTKISFHTRGPERIRKSTPVHGDAVVDLHDWSRIQIRLSSVDIFLLMTRAPLMLIFSKGSALMMQSKKRSIDFF
jgi:hypothetical protein